MRRPNKLPRGSIDMKRIRLSESPRQMDFWESNVALLHYTLPVGISDIELQRVRVALIRQRRESDQRHENWKRWMYSMRCIIGQFGYRAYKKNNRIIVERIPYRSYALREQMKMRNIR